MVLTNRMKLLLFSLSVVLLLLCMASSMVYGYTDTGWHTAWEAFTDYNGSNEHIVIQHVRLPRSLIAAVVGASLAVAGALMQALTKNPLASPSIFGIQAGAGFFIVVSFSFFSVSSIQGFTWIAFAGAGVAAFIVYFIGSLGRDGLTPIKLTLAGAAVAALFSSLTQGLLVTNEAALDQVLFWLAGSVQGRKLSSLTAVLPYIAMAGIICAVLAPKINILTMGEEVARSLGLKTGLVKLFAGLAVILLAGGAVAVAGPIGFIGIVIPHVARFVAGNDYRWILPYCAVLGGILLVAADIAARYVVMPEEVPVGVMTAIIGTPFFIYIARRGFQTR
ncbi:iron complex transport system permease protein [Kroppenstedtia eburnea]|uniref:Iron complex transport system permease protein n=2 Tax=Kroppenstedtia eburnea TaxID=714067 RepID=A0A1N7LAL0_9BACL|nr:iron complex transport system permease protein [Kroppenstedtia eburnea]